VFPELTAWENVQVKNQLTHFKSDAEITQWFEQLGIADKRATKLGHLSYGQQQRVALMRALCQPFDFLLADEPVSHLDDACAQATARLITREASRQGAAVVATSIGRHLPLSYDKEIKL
jgi:ABC-type phosphate/phosphonate transport system ATPase subunit